MKTKLIASLAHGLTLDSSVYKEAIDRQSRSTFTPPDFEFDTRSQRFRYTSGASKGRFAPLEAVTNLTQKAIDHQRVIADELCEKLFDGALRLSEWETKAATLIRTTSIWQYSIGSGGIGRLTQKDYGIVGAQLRREYLYLRRFTYQIQQGELTKAQIRSRLGLYFEKTYTLYERGRMESHKAAGYQWEKRITTAKESCADCLYWESIGVVAIGTLPTPGNQSSCLSNCRCTLRFYREKPEGADTLSLMSGNGWIRGRSIAVELRSKLTN